MSCAILRLRSSISIHAPREGGDTVDDIRKAVRALFQSTPPARGATREAVFLRVALRHFNPRPPRGGRRHIAFNAAHVVGISIHAPREGGDSAPTERERTTSIFQSTPPARGATKDFVIKAVTAKISIHAPREGGDPPVSVHRVPSHDFNPRPPRGGRPLTCTRGRFQSIFQSTPPARGATPSLFGLSDTKIISIHAPREGGDGVRRYAVEGQCNFNPRPPRGGRLFHNVLGAITQVISIHAPREGGDR